MKTNSEVSPPAELVSELGSSYSIWQKLIAELSSAFPGLRQEWKSSKLPFGRVCLLKQKDRTLIYLLPSKSAFEVSLVLGERAVALALAADLSKEIQRMISEARQYAEGRGIRFPLKSISQIAEVCDLVKIKTTPK